IIMPQQQAPAESEGEAEQEPPQVSEQQKLQAIEKQKSQLQDHLSSARASHGDDVSPAEARKKNVTPDGKKVGRNDPCPCGSGKKYKNCCGK
ncbi:MAG: SEC-C domain-containing protein, partial [Selenomonadaceae bacterium]|nr:SEC-C domain-containing protein [Selenomonadaceae bacterium]